MFDIGRSHNVIDNYIVNHTYKAHLVDARTQFVNDAIQKQMIYIDSHEERLDIDRINHSIPFALNDVKPSFNV